MPTKKWNFQIFHLVTDISYEIPMKCLQVAALRIPKKISKPVVYTMFEVQFNEFRLKASRKFKRIDNQSNVLIFGNKRYMHMNEVFQLLKNESCPVLILNQNTYESSWTDHLLNPDVIKPQRDYIFFNVNIGDKQSGYLIVEIYTDIQPKMCKKFMDIFQRNVVSLGHFKVFKDGWFEFGISPRLNQIGTISKADLSHDSRGVFSWTNDFKFDCDSYFIHFVPYQYFDQFRTVIGRVIHGDRTLHELEQITTNFGRPEVEIRIATCGIVPIGLNIPSTFNYTDWNRSLNHLFFAPSKEFIKPPSQKPTSLKTLLQKDGEILCPILKEDPVIESQPQSSLKISSSSSLDSSSKSSFSTPDTLSSFSDFNKEPMTLCIDGRLNEKSSQELIKMPLQRSYFDKLSVKEKLYTKIEMMSDKCSNASSDFTTFLKNQNCPSIGMDTFQL